MAAPAPPTSPAAPTWLVIVLCVALAALVVFAFGGAVGHDFVSFDDPGYVYENPHVTGGLTTENIGWAFTRVHMGNWHPLTWLSHMLDWELFGDDPAGHHGTNVLLHAAVAVGLLLAWRALTGRLWVPALAAALFAVHPLRVESVAWVSERKDLLAGLGFVAVLAAWASYAKRPDRERSMLVLLALGAGLLAKPMLVTVPCVLLLLDAWPMRRLALGARPDPDPAPDAVRSGPSLFATRSPRSLIGEVLPLVGLVVVSVVVTVFAQREGHAVQSLDAWPMGDRLLNLPVAYVAYLVDLVAPHDLAFLYPHPAGVPGVDLELQAGVCAAVLVVFSLGAIHLARRGRPWWLVGWLWFCGMLVPVAGLVQVGVQGHADRYTYLPALGLIIAVAHELGAFVDGRPRTRPAVVGGCLVVIALLVGATRTQVTTWRDGETLYRHALAVTEHNPTAHTLLGVELLRNDQLDDARAQFERAIAMSPELVKAHHNLGTIALRQERLDDAEAHFRQALALKPDLAPAYNDLAVIATRRGDMAGARRLLRQALQHDPDDARAAANLRALDRRGR